MIRFIQKMTAMLVTLFAGVAVFAQVTTSSLGGRVADEAGEPLAGAAIVAVHTPTGTQYATIANSEGILCRDDNDPGGGCGPETGRAL